MPNHRDEFPYQLIRKAKLKSSKTLNLGLCTLKEFPKEILELEFLEELILIDTGIEIIPDSIYQLKNLKILDVRKNSIQDIPNFTKLRMNYNSYKFLEKKLSMENIIGLRFQQEDISELENCINFKNLQFLDLIDLDIQKLPDIIINLPNLKILNISGCEKLKELPKDIRNLISLEEIELVDLGIKKLPDTILQLHNLKIISLCFCKELIELPSEIEKLTSLEELHLRGLNIEKLPDSVTNLPNLKIIELFECQKLIDHRLDEIGKLTFLEEIDFSHSSIEKLSDSIINLPNLKNLYLYQCKNLKELPYDFGKIFSLETLALSGSSIKKLPESIIKLSNLKKINLSSCERLEELPNEFGNLFSLENLDVMSLNIEILPDSIIKLSNLRTINLANCEKLKELPNEFENLTSLEEIDLAETRLKKLNLSSSKIQRLNIKGAFFLTDYLETSYDIPLAKYLNVDETKIRKIHKITENSKCLEELSCEKNGIRFLPDSILNLLSIKNLNLGSNRISYLSPEICRFLDSRGIQLSEAFQDNPLEFPPSAVVDKGNEAVLDFLKKREDDAENLPQYRVIFAGEGGSGKSSLVDVLTGRGFDDTKETTKKIRIVTEPFEKENMTVHFWDFGGQENMHSAHRTFFTDDMLYVIVLDSRKEEKPDEWLRFIGTKTGNKKAIIVLNKIDLNPHYDLDKNNLRVKYPFIIDFFKVSCQSEENIQEFKNTLLTEIKKNYLKPPVENWKFVKNEIFEFKNKSIRQISSEAFKEICDKNYISNERNALGDYLHKIGFIFKALNSRIIVLDSEWLINGVYSIIANEKVINENGRVRLEDYFNIFNKEDQQKYSENDFEDILKLMKDSELCFEEDKGKYILPALLKKETPDSISIKRNIRDQLKIYIEYKNYLNSSILYQFIARMHKSSVEKLYWRTGIYLEEGKNSAIIESDENLRRISISIHGENKRDYFEKEILPKFIEIHKGYIIQFDILIDIPISDPARTLEVNYEELKYLEKKNQGIYPSYQTERDYDIKKIFENSLYAQKREPNDLQEELTQILNKKFDELYLYFRIDLKEEKEYEKEVLKWLQISDLNLFTYENRIRLINSEFMRALFLKLKASDYSMYIAQTCRVIEGELKWKFFIDTFEMENYKDIRTELEQKLREFFPDEFQIKENGKVPENSKTLLGFDLKDKEQKLMFEHLKKTFKFYYEKIWKKNELNKIAFFAPYRDFNIQKESYDKFISLLEDIQNEYRNKVVHSDHEEGKRIFPERDADKFRDMAKEWFRIWISGWENKNITPSQ